MPAGTPKAAVKPLTHEEEGDGLNVPEAVRPYLYDNSGEIVGCAREEHLEGWFANQEVFSVQFVVPDGSSLDVECKFYRREVVGSKGIAAAVLTAVNEAIDRGIRAHLDAGRGANGAALVCGDCQA